jgi:hypothetical protein
MTTYSLSDVSDIGKTGLAFATQATLSNAAAATDRIPPGIILLVRNANASSLTVTLVTVDTADGDLSVGDRAQSAVAATNGLALIHIPNYWPYVDPADGLVAVTFSVTSSVTHALVNIP